MRKYKITIIILAVLLAAVSSLYIWEITKKTEESSLVGETVMTDTGNTAAEEKNDEGESLLAVAEETTEKYSEENNYESETTTEEDAPFKYVAVGNSIAVHGITSSWWNECGMGASRAENDYFHIVEKHLSAEKENVDARVINLSSWETQWYDRYECLYVLDGYLQPDTDLVTIQLGENISETSTLYADLAALVNYIRESSPEAQIILVDNFWTNWDVTGAKEGIASEYGLGFASLDEIKDDPCYQCGYGTAVYDAKDGVHYVDDEGVAIHPGDAGMAYIANAIISLIEE